MTDRLTLLGVSVGVLFALSQLVDTTGVFGVVTYDLAALLAVTMAVVGLRRHRPAAQRLWLLILGGLVLFVVADLIWNGLLLAGREPDGTGPLDVLYLSAYPLLAIGAWLLARRRGVALGREAFLDALALVVPAGAVAWALVIEPAFADGYSALDLAVTIAYPLLDLLCIAAACWLGFGGKVLASQRLLLLGLVATFAADVLYAGVVAVGVDLPLDDVAWAAGYVFIGAAFLHPSMADVGSPIDHLDSRLSRRRFLLLGIATVVTPSVQILRNWSDRAEVVLSGATIFIVVLVVLRLAGLLREVDAARRGQLRADRRFRAFVQDAGELLLLLDRDRRITYVSPAVTRLAGVDPDDLIGRSGADLVHPDDTDLVALALDDVAARPGDTVRYQFRFAGIDGTWHWHDATATNLLFDPDVEGIVIHQRDVTAQRAAADSLRTRALQQSAVARIGALALDGTPTERILTEAVALVRQTLGTASCQLFRLTADGTSLALEAASGLARELVGEVTIPAGRQSQSGYTLVLGGPVVSTDLASEPRFDRPDHLADVVRSSASVIVDGPDAPYGVLIAHDTALRSFTQDDVGFLQLAANALALVLERRATEAAVEWRALHDSLTGLPNRDRLLERIEAALSRNAPGKVALLFCDVDHFKVVNDGLGHDAGDQLLVTVAQRLRTAAGPGDVVARFGGDEFVVLRDGATGENDALDLAHAILRAIAEPVDVGGDLLQLDASVGIALAERGRATAAELLSDADAAMYRAKERGRGRAELFDDELRAQVVHRLRTEAALRDAVAGDQLRLHYQPVVDLESGRVVAVEALLRWLQPDGSLLAPAAFVPIAEEHGLIEEIGTWVMEEACRQLARWDAEGVNVEAAVNIAPRQLLGGDLPSVVRAACGATGIDPSRLTLELTERALLRDADAAVSAAEELAALGTRLSIDDFGTGWSSLAYLKRLPVAELKIDRAFVAEVAASGADRAIVEATVQLAGALGLRTVAEGIESGQQAATLTAMGCQRGQGFLFCPPLPPEELLLEQDATAAQ